MTIAQEPLHPGSRWPLVTWMVTGILVIISAILGFVVLASAQEDAVAPGLWSAICRAIGIPASRAPAALVTAPLRTPTNIAWTGETLGKIAAGDPVRGAFVAKNCMACHGQSGTNTALVIPLLDGMEAAVIYKQLDDYRSGKRAWGVMGAIARALSPEDAANVAAYFASRPGPLRADTGIRVPVGGRSLAQADPAIRLVYAGDPQRSIAPCSACHGPGGYKTGAPALGGQHPAYIERQLAAFAQGTRRNDIFEQMRVIAKHLTPDERRALAAFYGAQSVGSAKSEKIASDQR